MPIITMEVQKMQKKSKQKSRKFFDKSKSFIKRYGVSVGVLGCALIAALVFFVGGNASKDKELKNTDLPPVRPAPTMNINPLLNNLSSIVTPKPEKNDKSIETVGIKKTSAAVPDLVKPVDGEIIKEFAKDTLVYSETLKEYGVHLGLDIKGELGEAVVACADGKVVEVGNDKLMGNYVIIEHNKKLKTAYYSLETASVKKGDKVATNDVIGAVGNTALAEVESGPHVHFEVLLAGERVDPAQFFEK
jgi:murein DD-endopeptidase MepM/ murein hydrolase activator NlpD